MSTADLLVEQMFSWIDQREHCAEQLKKLAKELESLREKCNASECVGSSVSVVGAAALLGAGVVTFFTGGAAAPLLGLAGGVYTGVGVTISVVTKITEHFSSSGTMKEAEEIEKKSNKIAEKIQQQFQRLKVEVMEGSSLTDPDEVERRVMAEILRAVARRSGVNLQINYHMFYDDHFFFQQRNMGPNLLMPLLSSTLSGILGFFALTFNGKKTQLLLAEGLKLLTKELTSIGVKTALKGGAMVVGGAVGLAFALPEAIDNWKDLIKKNHVTKASQSLRDTADTILQTCRTLRKQFDDMKRMLVEMERQREREERERLQQERERQERERLQREREKEEMERLQRERERQERKRLQRERERQKMERLQREREREEMERLQQERERQERERLQREREKEEMERLQRERERQERKRLQRERERQKMERLQRERERQEMERLQREHEREEMERLQREREREEMERLQRERERQKMERLQREREREEMERLQRERERQKMERLQQEREREEMERLQREREREEMERLQRERERQKMERLQREREREKNPAQERSGNQRTEQKGSEQDTENQLNKQTGSDQQGGGDQADKERDDEDEDSDSEEEESDSEEEESDSEDEESDSEEEESDSEDEESESESEEETEDDERQQTGRKKRTKYNRKKGTQGEQRGKKESEVVTQDGRIGQDQKTNSNINKEGNQESDNNQRPPASINAGLLNVRSMNSKPTDIKEIITENNLDVMSTTETWLNSNKENTLRRASPENFSCCESSRAGRGGGVAIQFSNELQSEQINFNTDISRSQYVAVALRHDEWNQPIPFISVYYPPGYTMQEFRVFLDEFEELLDEVFKKFNSIIVTGDFNIPNNQEKRHFTDEFYHLLKKYDLDQHVWEPTHNKGNTLDLVITRGVQISDLSVQKVNKTNPKTNKDQFDHFLITFRARPKDEERGKRKKKQEQRKKKKEE